MRKLSLCLLIILSAALFISCNNRVKYQFLQSTSEIKSVEIVTVGDMKSIENNQTTVCVIDDVDEFLEKFNKLDCYRHFSDPQGVGTNSTVIKIIYNNDDYELISWCGQSQYTSKYKFKYYKGFCNFDENQFNDFISTYTDQ